MTPRKFTLLTEISEVNLRLGWKWLRCFLEIFANFLYYVSTQKRSHRYFLAKAKV